MEKLRSTLKQLVRDWSEEVSGAFLLSYIFVYRLVAHVSDFQGKPERDACYEPMKQALLEHFSDIPEEERYRLIIHE